MIRRFPAPVVGVPASRSYYHQIVSIVAESDAQSMGWDAFFDACRDNYQKPDADESYSESYLKRVLPTFETLGVIDRTDDIVSLPQPAERWFRDEISFENFLWYSLKRSWILQNKKPRGIEGLREVHDAVIQLTDETTTDDMVTRGAIRDYLANDRNYEFNENDIRGYPTLLTQLCALQKEGSQYTPGPLTSRFKDRLLDSDLFRLFERRLRREGPHVKPPDDRVKRDLAKYYMYRESGGLGKERRWYETFWKDYLDETARAGETYQARLRKRDEYQSESSERDNVFMAVRNKYESLESSQIRGLSTGVLQRMRDAESPEEAWRIKISAGSGVSRLDLETLISNNRPQYTFPKNFALYPWQQDAVDEWFKDGTKSEAGSGIVQVVTGAGKTIMALEVVRQWLKENPNGVVTVIVPTKVLMHQWLTELASKLNVPADEIGWAGGGHKDGFEEGRRILVSIVNSAVKEDYLAERLSAAEDPPHLLVADECHRYTGEVFSNIFNYPRTAALGLSATPLSESLNSPGTKDEIEQRANVDLTDDDRLLLDELGAVYYTLTYDEGLSRGLIPEFSINYIGFELTAAERQTYDLLTRKISNTLSDIRSQYGHHLDSMGGDFFQNLQVLLQRDDLSTPEIGDYFEYTSERRELVADAAPRQATTLDLLETTLEEEQKAIVFQERIDQLERMVAPLERRGRNVESETDVDPDNDYRTQLYELYPELQTVDKKMEDLFSRAEYKPVMYHSGHSRAIWNDFGMEWFRENGFANVMLSVKALIEGVDVPSADVGIIRVSGSSVRQRIQTLGRVLRTGEDPDKRSEMYILYARNTVDEKIFERHDWKNEVANAEVNHYIWQTDESAIDGQLRPATDDEIPEVEPYEPPEVPDPESLERGDPYDGPLDGYEISVDADSNPFESRQNSRRHIITPAIEDAAEFVHEKKGGGTITITEAGHMVTRLPDQGPVFLGVLDGGIEEIEYGADTGTLSEGAPSSLDEL